MSSNLIDIHLAFKHLNLCQADLNTQIRKAGGPDWLPPNNPQFRNDKRTAIQTMLATHNQDDFTPAEAGVLALPPTAQGLVKEINQQKDQLKTLITGLRSTEGTKGMRVDRIVATLEQNTAPHGRDKAASEALKKLQLSRVNLLWLYRHVRLLPPEVVSISYSRTFNERIIEKATFDDALARANNILGEQGVALLESVLAGLPPKTPLCFCKEYPPHLKANVVYRDYCEKEGKVINKRMTFRTPTPILYQGTSLPKIRWPSNDADTQRQLRSDRRVSDTPLIRGINLYTYKEKGNHDSRKEG